MRTVLIIGIGAGDPDHITIQAIKALNRADVVFIPDKGAEKEDLRRLRHAICARYVENRTLRFIDVPVPERGPAGADYKATVAAWHERIAKAYAELFESELADGGCGAFLVWGDPTLYDSTLRIVESVRRRNDLPIDYEIIPGITSVQALAARHRVALNRVGEPVHITTGRRLAESDFGEGQSVVVMLDGEQAFTRIVQQDLDVHWGAYLGTTDEILIAGRLSDVSEKIVRTRRAARDRKGWIMDTYLLRRRGSD